MEPITEVQASELTGGIGQVIVNLGPVLHTRVEGAFIHVEVEVTRWSAATGASETASEPLFLHCTDSVWVTK
jgi:hypothetical protein